MGALRRSGRAQFRLPTSASRARRATITWFYSEFYPAPGRAGLEGQGTWAAAHVFSCRARSIRRGSTASSDGASGDDERRRAGRGAAPAPRARRRRASTSSSTTSSCTGAGGTRTLRVTVDRPGGVDLDAITAVTQAVSPILDDAPDAHRLVPARSEQPGCRARAAHARALRGRASAPPSRSRSAPSPARGACTACSSTPAPSDCTVEVDGEREQHRLRRHHAGAHRVRVGPATSPRPAAHAPRSEQPGPPRAKG